MKTKISHLFLSAFFALFALTACQDEATEVNTSNEQENIDPSSVLASLMSRTTANFGAGDNILDESSCFSVELPVTIIVSGITIIIESEEDLEQLEDLLDELEDDEGFLDFLFPITIIFNDYTEIVIENEDQLENFITECDSDIDNTIECIDFVYPISFSVFNSDFNIVDTITIDNDEELYNFLEDLEEDEDALIVSLNYPVVLEYSNGETIEVTSNQELADAIGDAESNCDNEEENECNEEDVAELLVECPWNFSDGTDAYNNYQLVFYEDGSLAIPEVETTSAIGGAWTLSSTDNGLVLNIYDLTAFQNDLGGEWLIVDCDNDEIEIIRGDYAIELEQDCEGDLGCSVAEINENIIECAWELETNLIDTTVLLYVYFTPNGQVLSGNNDGTENQIGTWELILVASDIFIEFTLQQGFEVLNGQWQVVECEGDELYLVNGSNYMALDQECDLNEGNEVFDCFGDFELVECLGPDNEAEFNLSAGTIGLIDCQYNFTPSFHVSEADAEANTNAIAETESYWSVTGQVYLRIEADNGNFEIFTIYLNTEECNYFECFGNYDLAVCDQDDEVVDGFGIFDLNLIFSNCPSDDTVYTFHETLADAENQINALTSPYTNVANPQTIYSRVSLAGNPPIYEIFVHNLIVEDCSNNSGCGEEDVDAFLAECIWNAVNYNGSDNLIEWNFDFEPNSQIVVIYTNTQTLDAEWTTSQSSDGVLVTFSNVAGPNIQVITGEWLVVECQENRLELHRGDDILVLERSCD